MLKVAEVEVWVWMGRAVVEVDTRQFWRGIRGM